ncbi:NAD(P)H-dependent oxidoreductase [Methanothrix sp.]|uniref:flavodoxin family protein n=1 Tax=Methanothrix sp. TaxID=90426 RepID=UPI0023568AB0|nr:NAD(P)H-dependent oxidoreductase [Methanothrix sp.]
MKVIAFNGSPRRDGNTATLLAAVLRELESQGIETELVHLIGTLAGCKACFKCKEIAHPFCRSHSRDQGPHRSGRFCGHGQWIYVQA